MANSHTCAGGTGETGLCVPFSFLELELPCLIYEVRVSEVRLTVQM